MRETPAQTVNFGAHKAARRCVNTPGHGTGRSVPMQDQPTAGLCGCGCGQPTEIATITRRERGEFMGQPKPFLFRHKRRITRIMGRLDESYDVDASSGCWVWKHARMSAGYGVVRSDGQARLAHRIMYERLVGPIPEGLHLDHLCRNPRCVNPDHLEPVTNAENIRRGAGVKLTWDDVHAIRASDEPAQVLAARYGVWPTHIRTIRAGVQWTRP